MRKIIYSIFLLCSCGYPVSYGEFDCVTTCGTRIWVINDESPWACDKAQAVEDTTIRYSEDLFPSGCKDLNRSALYVQRSDTFTVRNIRVGGVTYCDTKFIAVGNVEPKDSAYAHEMFHMMQKCPYDEQYADPWHPGWSELKIWEKIDQIHAELSK